MNFGDSATKKFATEEKCKFSGLDEELAHQRIQELNAATKLEDLRSLKSVRLHKLQGPLKEFWSIDINYPWRLIFKFDGNASDVRIADTH
jgi:proteic killer suppression protein